MQKILIGVTALALSGAWLGASPALAQIAAAPQEPAAAAPTDQNVDGLDGTAYAELSFKVEPAYVAFGPAGGFFPERARRDGVWGYAVIACRVGADLTLTDCDLVKESARDFGFGLAVQAMVDRGRITSAKPDAQQPHLPDGRVLVRVDFKPGGEVLATQGTVNGVALTPVQYAPVAPSFFPPRAFRADLGGYALIGCKLGPDGRLGDCDVRNEIPANYGFGEAALRMAAARAVIAAKPDAEAAHTPEGKVLVCVVFKSRVKPD